MSSNPIRIKVTRAFSIGKRQVLTCQIQHLNPHELIGKDMFFYPRHGPAICIRIAGVSTASDTVNHTYDLLYTREVIDTSEFSDESVITDS